jgi:MoaA/NifB/PqqE/SkfB family radical SAM enzyme
LEGKIGRISLALDGSTNEMNHIMRSERGYLDIVTGLMKQIKERGIPISIKTVASRKNIKDIPHMVEILAKYSPDVWLITQFTPNNRGDRYREEFEISNDEFQRLRTKIKGTPFKVALRSSEITTTLPFFFLDSNGGVLTASAKNPKGEINIGSIFKQEIEELWKKIASINKVNQYYMENIWTERIY